MVSLLSEEATRPSAQGWAGRAKARLGHRPGVSLRDGAQDKESGLPSPPLRLG
jgi:hypothetical protein